MASNGPDAQRPNRGSYVVRAPRRTDAMQGALCNAYRRNDNLPEDIDMLLKRLDRFD